MNNIKNGFLLVVIALAMACAACEKRMVAGVGEMFPPNSTNPPDESSTSGAITREPASVSSPTPSPSPSPRPTASPKKR